MFCEFLTIFVSQTDIIVNSLIRYIAGTVAIAVIAIASVLQFHHHGCNGVVFIPVCGFDIAIGDCCGAVQGESGCMAHACHGHHGDDGQDCSMHIGDTVSPCRGQDLQQSMVMDCVPVVVPEVPDIEADRKAAYCCYEGDTGVLMPGLLTVNAFRGPPAA